MKREDAGLGLLKLACTLKVVRAELSCGAFYFSWRNLWRKVGGIECYPQAVSRMALCVIGKGFRTGECDQAVGQPCVGGEGANGIPDASVKFS